jgi:hypothetical protein
MWGCCSRCSTPNTQTCTPEGCSNCRSGCALQLLATAVWSSCREDLHKEYGLLELLLVCVAAGKGTALCCSCCCCSSKTVVLKLAKAAHGTLRESEVILEEFTCVLCDLLLRECATLCALRRCRACMAGVKDEQTCKHVRVMHKPMRNISVVAGLPCFCLQRDNLQKLERHDSRHQRSA